MDDSRLWRFVGLRKHSGSDSNSPVSHAPAAGGAAPGVRSLYPPFGASTLRSAEPVPSIRRSLYPPFGGASTLRSEPLPSVRSLYPPFRASTLRSEPLPS
eukprot:1182244-Prorocentrum_minimum.AAC.4